MQSMIGFLPNTGEERKALSTWCNQGLFCVYFIHWSSRHQGGLIRLLKSAVPGRALTEKRPYNTNYDSCTTTTTTLRALTKKPQPILHKVGSVGVFAVVWDWSAIGMVVCRKEGWSGNSLWSLELKNFLCETHARRRRVGEERWHGKSGVSRVTRDLERLSPLTFYLVQLISRHQYDDYGY